MSQEHNILMGELVNWANRRIARLGLEGKIGVTYGAGYAELIDCNGTLLDRQFTDYTDSGFRPQGFYALVIRTEKKWRAFLRGECQHPWGLASERKRKAGA
jgi:hypothetical protein